MKLSRGVDSVIDVALSIVDEQGAAALTLSAVAKRAGIATPSLYKHVNSLAQLRTLVAARVLDDMTAQSTAAVLGLSGDDAMITLMKQFRGYTVAYPARYATVPADPMHDADLAPSANRFFDVFLAVLRGYGLSGSAAVHATRCLRVIVHGFAAVETAGGFGLAEDPDETYDRLIRMYLRSLT